MAAKLAPPPQSRKSLESAGMARLFGPRTHNPAATAAPAPAAAVADTATGDAAAAAVAESPAAAFAATAAAATDGAVLPDMVAESLLTALVPRI